MRAIKFRAWHPSAKKMIPYEDFLLYDHGTEPVSFVMSLRGEPYNYQYMQFTGLTDKNGVEIYEGDIVKLRDVDGSEFDILEVKWATNGYHLYKKDQTGWRSSLAYHDDEFDIEVIGNIYENKELLNGKD